MSFLLLQGTKWYLPSNEADKRQSIAVLEPVENLDHALNYYSLQSEYRFQGFAEVRKTEFVNKEELDGFESKF